MRGYTGLISDRRGQFLGNWAAPNCRARIPAPVAQLLRGPADVGRQVQQLFEAIRLRLEPELAAASFLGPLGIDALIYRSEEGGARLKPIVEINPRCTMGRMTLEFMKRTESGRYGLFRLIRRSDLRAAGADEFSKYARRLVKRFPLCLAGDPIPRINEGVLCLNDPARARVCLATLQVGRSLAALDFPAGATIAPLSGRLQGDAGRAEAR
jgi:hypothetical protein